MSKILFPAIEHFLKGLKRGLIVSVILPDRLTSSQEQHAAIVSAVTEGILLGKGCDTLVCRVEVTDFDASASSLETADGRGISQEALRDFVDSKFPFNDNTVIFLGNNVRSLIVRIASAKSDNLIGGIRNQLAEATKRQLTGTRPAFLVACFKDLTNAQIEELAGADLPTEAGATPLQRMTSKFMEDPKRNFVHTLVYNGQAGTPVMKSGELRAPRNSYVFRNPMHPLAGDLDCRFGV